MAKSKLDGTPSGATGPAASTAPRTLGPVSDLERHLPSDWWRTLFNSLYLKTDGDVVENDGNTRREVDLVLQYAGLTPDQFVLDLCCGQGRHALELARRGYHRVTGIDRSRYLIRLARRRARTEGLKVNFHEGDARKFRLRGMQFDAVMMMGNSFGYFEQQAEDEVLLRNVAHLLGPGGKLVLDIVDGCWMRSNFERRSWEWIDENHFVCRERALASDEHRLISREVITHAEKGVLADQFYAERLYSREEIEALLKRLGYFEINVHDVLEADSDRGQDLGMMARRLLLTARPPEHPVSRKKPHAIKAVTILMGDPRLPDTVKVNGQFNSEDFVTINKMKEALGSLKGYRFKTFDNHAKLLQTMTADPPQFVLNLCDEGYMNDAFKELHVPALLEMLGVPYSGAGPACLGLCYNKNLVRAIAEALEVPVPLETYISSDESGATLPSTFPALLKPNFGDSSIGITKDAVVYNADQLLGYIDRMHKDLGRCSILVQEFLPGTEYSIGIVGNPGYSYTVLPPLEVDYSGLQEGLPKILGYESKWLPDSPYWNQISYKEAKLEDDRLRQMYDYSNVLFARLDCRDYARFDFRADANGVIKLLEVNPNPGWCWDGKMNIMAGFAGLSYADLLEMIVKAAEERIEGSANGRGNGNGNGAH